jgi:hypothetical protein
LVLLLEFSQSLMEGVDLLLLFLNDLQVVIEIVLDCAGVLLGLVQPLLQRTRHIITAASTQ